MCKYIWKTNQNEKKSFWLIFSIIHLLYERTQDIKYFIKKCPLFYVRLIWMFYFCRENRDFLGDMIMVNINKDLIEL